MRFEIVKSLRQAKIFVGNLPRDIRSREVEDIFYKFGRIVSVEMKRPHGKAPYCFVEFEDSRDARDAAFDRNGYKIDGVKIRVEMSYGKKQGHSYNHDVQFFEARRYKYWISVKGLPPSGSWQDLKDHMKELNLRMRHVNVYHDGTGIATFDTREDLEDGLRVMEGTKFKSHRGESTYIKVREGRFDDDEKSHSSPNKRYNRRQRSRSAASSERNRSRSPVKKYRSRSRSTSPRPVKNRSNSRSRSPVLQKSRTKSESSSKNSQDFGGESSTIAIKKESSYREKSKYDRSSRYDNQSPTSS